MFKNYVWDWGMFLEPVSTGEPTNYLGWLLDGFYNTVILSVLAIALALVIGSVMGVLRTMPNRALSSLGAVYVSVFRNVPLIVQLFIWYFVVPEILPSGLGDWFKQLSSFTQMMGSAVVCLALYTGARFCEQIRSGINTLPIGQRSAALALGLTLPQAYRYVILPVAFRVIIPPLTSDFTGVFKNSAVASTIGLLELSAQSQQLVDYTAHAYESFIAATAIYIVINWIVMASMRWVEASTRLPGFIGGKS